MARIVLVHGIGQTQQGADTLEEEWIPALAAGVRRAGRPDVADGLWPQDRGARTVRMAHYGDLFLAPGGQGDGNPAGGEGVDDLLDQLALEWLRVAAERAPDLRDRGDAARVLAGVDAGDDAGAMGVRAAGRPVLNALTRLRWFAPLALTAAGGVVKRSLRQVPRYFADSEIRDTARRRVLDLIGEDTRLVIGHSLGSVVAYEALHDHTGRPVTFITIGSPLGMRTLIHERLEPRPPGIPDSVTAWWNFADEDDLVAAVLDLNPAFPNERGLTIATNSDLDNEATPHGAVPYLTKKSVGAAVITALDPQT